jgi:hypothetical protein
LLRCRPKELEKRAQKFDASFEKNLILKHDKTEKQKSQTNFVALNRGASFLSV